MPIPWRAVDSELLYLEDLFVRPEMRAVASAICLFLLNIIGLGIGPQGVGILSDYLRPEYGNESLRYALMVFGTVNLWCALHYFLGARYLLKDIERAGIAEELLEEP